MDKVVIGREAYDKIMHYVNKTNFEVSGFGNVEVIDGVPTVTDIILLKQENHATETEIDGASFAKAIYDHYTLGTKGELKFWWHSHVNMGCFWSGTDMATIKSLTKDGWYIHGVFNKKGEYKLAYTNNDPFPIMLDDLDLEIDENLIQDDDIFTKQLELLEVEGKIAQIESDIAKIIADKCDPIYDELVTEKKYVYQSQYKGMTYGNNKVGKQGKLLTMTDNTPSDLTTTYTGKIMNECMTTDGDKPFAKYFFSDEEGALELLALGFSLKEIEYMANYCWINDAYDLSQYTQLTGEDIYTILKNDVK